MSITSRFANRHSRRGAVLVEVALILPLFLILILAILELGNLFFVRQAMLNAARDAARSFAIGEFNSAETAALAQQRLPELDSGFVVTTSPDQSGSIDRWVQISVPIQSAALNDPLGILGSGDMEVRVTMRAED